MEKSKYIPGFDWVRIIGALLVTMAHFNCFQTFNSMYPLVYSMVGVVVPTFFYMSGYLSASDMDKSKSRIKKQVIKYAAIYLAFEFALVLHDHITEYRETGMFNTAQFTIDYLKCFVDRYKDSYQLWFIPALLYPMMLNAFLSRKSRKPVILATLLVLLATTANLIDMGTFFERLTAAFPSIEKVFLATELQRIWVYALEGLLFTTIGFDIKTWKIRRGYLLLAVIPLIVFELTVKYVGMARVLLSLLLFDGITRLPGQFLRPYHPEISFFSSTLFFMHLSELLFLQRNLRTNDTTNLLLVLAVHAFATVILWYCRQKSKKQKVIGIAENGFQQNNSAVSGCL